MRLQNPINLFPESTKQVTAPKSALSVVDDLIVNTPRNGVEPSLITDGTKYSSNELVKFRNAIGELFKNNGLYNQWIDAVKNNRLMNDDLLSEQFTPYDNEFARLHKSVQDAFTLSGRQDLADQFGTTVSVYTANRHPIDFIAALLKGASAPVVRQAQSNQYTVLMPFVPLMKEALNNKGLAAPNGLPELTQLFYNTFVTQAPGTNNKVMNFDGMTAQQLYHVDQSIVDAVAGYVKDLADRKKSGESLSKIQDMIANAGLKVEQGLTNAATTQAEQKIGEGVLQNSKTILIVVAVVVIALLYFMFKGK